MGCFGCTLRLLLVSCFATAFASGFSCLLLLLSVFLRQFGASPQVVAASIVLFLATSVHLKFRPYADPKHNMVESIGLHACQLQLLITLMSNMIGRVDRLVPQSPIGPVSTMVVISFVFASTAQFFWVSVLWTVRRSQSTDGVVGNVARCCGKKMPRLCKAVEVGREEERTQKTKEKEAGTRSGAHNQGRRSIARAMARGTGRAGTIKGSLRYNVKVAMHLKRGIGAAEQHATTSAALQQKLAAQQSMARSRLHNRIRSRSRNMSVGAVGRGRAAGTVTSATMVVPAATAVQEPVDDHRAE